MVSDQEFLTIEETMMLMWYRSLSSFEQVGAQHYLHSHDDYWILSASIEVKNELDCAFFLTSTEQTDKF